MRFLIFSLLFAAAVWAIPPPALSSTIIGNGDRLAAATDGGTLLGSPVAFAAQEVGASAESVVG